MWLSRDNHIFLNLREEFFKLVNFLAIKKTKKSEALATVKPKKRPQSAIEPYKFSNLWLEFDNMFERFRRDMEKVMWPRESALGRELRTAMTEMNIPSVDIEDRGNDFLVTIEAAGYDKDEIDINVCGNSVEVSGCKETVQDEKTKQYVRKERMSESFYRTFTVPEEVKYEEISADLKNGVLEITLPKQNPKPRRKVAIK